MVEAHWARLRAAQAAEAGVTLGALFEAEPGRIDAMRAEAAGLTLHWSRALIGPEGRAALLALAGDPAVTAARDAMAAGAPVNVTEGRAARHMDLRAPAPAVEVVMAAARAAELADRLRRDGTRTVIWLGIGGSDLGPRLGVLALGDPPGDQGVGPEIRFVSNVDPFAIRRALAGADPATTHVLIASKSFTTQETMLNAQAARDWLVAALGEDGAAGRVGAVTAAPEKAAAFGIAEDLILPFWDWVGGRFSVWSSVGLPIRIAAGNAAFDAFLAGAHAMDRHFLEAPAHANMALILAALDLWNLNLLGLGALAVVPYAEALALLPAYLQQLVMESNGKGVTANGAPAPLSAAPIVWGAAGTDAQHSFFQWLHQAPGICPVEFVLPLAAAPERQAQQTALTAHCLAQGSALMLGRDRAATEATMAGEGADPVEIIRLAAHRMFPGGRPSTLILMDGLTPARLGALIALYEHRVAAAAWMAEINPFDQWGVEYGKTLSRRIAPMLADQPGAGHEAAPDPLTARLIAEIQTRGHPGNTD